MALFRSRPPPRPTRDRAVAELVRAHAQLVWRTLRRLGVLPADLEDATQRVFIIVAQKFDEIKPGRERSFVFGTAMRVAAQVRRHRRGRREDPLDEIADPADPGLSPEASAENRRRLSQLGEILERMPEELSRTFLLYELERWTMAEIAEEHGIALGTVASRLRRSRERFQADLERLERDGRRTGS
jgi:RNA polymerase sigma-70 factor (ECF subfamily)